MKRIEAVFIGARHTVCGHLITIDPAVGTDAEWINCDNCQQLKHASEFVAEYGMPTEEK